jgi:hypothetical protein
MKISEIMLGYVVFILYIYFVIKIERDMKIREFYLENYPSDELGVEVNENGTFTGLLNVLFTEGDVYEYIGVGDSVIRERLFERLAEELGTPYDYVYNLWLN